MRRLTAIAFILLSLSLKANTPPAAILGLDEYLAAIRETHPMLGNAVIQEQLGKAYLQKARGGFDPAFSSDFKGKQFKGTNYYRVFDSEFNMPLWMGAEINAGYELADGSFLSAENTLPSNGLGRIGISIPLMSGLLLDERRSELAISRLTRENYELYGARIYNKVLKQGISDYIEWWRSRQINAIYEESYALAQVRFNGTRSRFTAGDGPAIDTTEAFILLNNRAQLLDASQLELTNQWLQIQNQMYAGQINTASEMRNPQEMTAESGMSDSLDFWESRLDELHPGLRIAANRVMENRIDQRMAAEKLRPKVDLQFNTIYALGENATGFSPSNYTAGVKFSMPLTWRKERSEWQIRKLQVTESENDRQQLYMQTYGMLLNAYNSALNYRELIDRQEIIVADYRRLLQAELRKFELGESSVFMVNARENSLIMQSEKLVQLQAKYLKTIATLYAELNLIDEFISKL